MRIHLNAGESLFVTFEEGEIAEPGEPQDGLRIEYNTGKSNKLVVTATYEDDHGRQGEIYCATFDDDLEVDDEPQPSASDRDEVVKVITCTSCGHPFEFTKGEQTFMKTVFKGNYRDPVRCRMCRKARMSRRLESEKGKEHEN